MCVHYHYQTDIDMIEYDVLSFNGEEEKKTTIKRK
jgi:hypothetical protein